MPSFTDPRQAVLARLRTLDLIKASDPSLVSSDYLKGYTRANRMTKTPLQLLDALAGIKPPSTIVQPPQTTVNAPKAHGGHRTPRPGKKLGRPPKKAKDKAVTVAIVLSCPKAAKALKSRAKRAHLTPGALIEREL